MSNLAVINYNDWNPSELIYSSPTKNDRGLTTVKVISKKTKRMLSISTPLLMTWGIQDFVDDKGESNGKYTISIQFPNEEYGTPNTESFLNKIKAFEEQLLNDAVKNSETWWGEHMDKSICKHSLFPTLKYPKNKTNGKVDTNKPPSLRAKIPYYDGKWGIEIFNTKNVLIFPCEDKNITPLDFVPKMCHVAGVLSCGGIWNNGKGWGVTWKFVQCMVKPNNVQSVVGRPMFELSKEEMNMMESTDNNDKNKLEQSFNNDNDLESFDASEKQPKKLNSTTVEDSDNEEEPQEVVEQTTVLEPLLVPDAKLDVEPVLESSPVKKVVKKTVVSTPTPEPVVQLTAPPVLKKKIIKKVAQPSA